MRKIVVCPECGTRTVVNTEKHKYRPKYCTYVKCRTVIDNAHPKLRILSVFQRKKKERKEATRQRFVARMQRLNFGFEKISKMMTKIFKWEKE